MTLGKLILRGTIGPLFVGHGAQKLFGAFGGRGIGATGEYFESQLGLRPGWLHAALAGAAETAGGAMVTVGFLTPVAQAILDGVMVTAVRKVHGRNGPWIERGGFEYNAVIMAALAFLAEQGAGRPSVDERRWPRLKGTLPMLLGLAAGVGGSLMSERTLSRLPAQAVARMGAASAPPEREPGAGATVGLEG
jgi:putative oxidoreductase